tara:strand:- start:565 stop:702 length:138 start_codon:yes stop_codon:yes gene_type:complete
MIEDGANPFENMPVKQYINNEENEEVVTGDSEMMEVVESFESEEE